MSDQKAVNEHPENDPADEEEAQANAARAGWDPANGDPPAVHGAFQEGLAASDRIEDLL